MPSDEFGVLNELHVTSDHCRIASHLPCKHGALNDASILILFVANGRIFWTARIDADQRQPRRLWQSFDQLVGRGRVPPTDITASVLHEFFLTRK